MLSIKKLELYGESLKERIQGINHFLLLSEMVELEDSIKNLTQNQFPVLIFIEPSGDSAGNEDSQVWNWPCFAYVLKKFDHTHETYRSRINTKASLQDLIQLVNDTMLADMHNHQPDSDHIHLMHRLQPSGMHIDPENDFLGCTGYSLSFKLITA